MRPVDEAAEVVGRAVEAGRREEVDAVVAPAEAAGELGHGHELDDGDPQLGQLVEPIGRGGPGPLGGEGADVHLVDDRPVDVGPLPVGVGPGEGAGVDHLRRPVRPFGLEARGGVGIRPLAVEPVAVEGAGADPLEDAGEVTVGLGVQEQGRGLAVVEDDLDPAPIGCPDPEADPIAGPDLGPDRQSPHRRRSRHQMRCPRVLLDGGPTSARPP